MKENSKETRASMLRRMTELLTAERERTRLALETTRRDSRLGYEWEQDYFYTPYVLEREDPDDRYDARGGDPPGTGVRTESERRNRTPVYAFSARSTRSMASSTSAALL